LDKETGLVYAGARYYDPVIGRLMGYDPVGFVEGSPQSFNRYAYGNNNPYSYVDPNGETPAHILKFAADVALNVAINYATTGQADVGGALVDSTLNIVNPLSSLQKANKLREIVGKSGVTNSTVQANKAAGDAVRDAIAARTGGAIEQNFRVTGGLRRVDVLDGTTAIESKVGRTSLTPRVRQELARDVKLLRSGQVDRVQWEFSPSGVTGKSGPTGPLRQKLEKFGIDIVE
jgi:RHS repeat-associated protein